jgi:hypothetical protein
MDKPAVVLGRIFVADQYASEILQPGEESLSGKGLARIR